MKTLKLPLPLKTITVVSLFALLGCVNRGSHTDITTPGGDSGVGGKIVPPTDGPMDQELPPPPPDSGPDVVFVDNCELDAGSSDGGDAGPPADAGPPSSCMTTFNFESPGGCALYGATLGMDPNPKNTDGFKRVYHTGNAYCGRGAMAIDVDLNGDTRLGGEVVIPINPAADYTGKTLSLAVKGSVAGGSNVRFQVLLVTTRYEPKSVDVQINTDYTPVSVVLPDMAGASAAGVIRISLQVHGNTTPYLGTVYVDEIDIHDTPDAGPSDGAVDLPRTDARDAAADVRDAPAGS